MGLKSRSASDLTLQTLWSPAAGFAVMQKYEACPKAKNRSFIIDHLLAFLRANLCQADNLTVLGTQLRNGLRQCCYVRHADDFDSAWIHCKLHGARRHLNS